MKAVIRVDGSRLERYLERVKRDGRVAAARALNRTMQTVQSRAGKVIAEDVGLPQRRVRDAMRFNAARPDKLVAEVVVTGKRIPLADFGARPTARGVTYRIGRRGRQLIPRAFLRTMRSGHTGVFRRRQGAGPLPRMRARQARQAAGMLLVGRLPIVEFFGPSLPHVASQAKVDEITREAERTLLPKNLEHELRFLAQRGGGA